MIKPTLDDIVAAQERIAEAVQSTPMELSRYLSDKLGDTVHLKLENLQRTGAFKLRGAHNMLAQLPKEALERGVVAASAGNHAQGVAYAATALGVQSTIFMPRGAALPKLQATKNYGADIRLRGSVFQETLASALEFVQETGAVFVPPYDDPRIIAGQGTVGLEILDKLPDADTVIVPIGGGGLIAGVAIAVKERAAQLGRSIRVIGVQSSGASAFAPSLEAGEPVTIQTKPTIADGIAVSRPGDLTFEIVRDYVDEIVSVSDDDIARALIVLLERAKQVVEPAGATGVAAILSGQIRGTGKTVALLSGGNIDLMFLERVISRGLTASQRYLTMRLALPDRPGQLAIISQIVSDEGANVVEVLHTQHDEWTGILDVTLDLSVTTRGAEHSQQVLEALRRAGYKPQIKLAGR